MQSQSLTVCDRAASEMRNGIQPSAYSSVGAMSALGQKRTLCSANRHVRFTPESGHLQCSYRCPLLGQEPTRSAPSPLTPAIAITRVGDVIAGHSLPLESVRSLLACTEGEV